jgi:acetyltransferase
MEIARSKGLRTMEGEVLKANSDMLHLAQSLGFRVETHPDDDAIRRVVRGL